MKFDIQYSFLLIFNFKSVDILICYKYKNENKKQSIHVGIIVTDTFD